MSKPTICVQCRYYLSSGLIKEPGSLRFLMSDAPVCCHPELIEEKLDYVTGKTTTHYPFCRMINKHGECKFWSCRKTFLQWLTLPSHCPAPKKEEGKE